MFSHRTISAVVALGLIVLVVFASELKNIREVILTILMAGAVLLLPVLCIWFADDMGEYAGNLFAPDLAKPVPGIAIRVAGWFSLLVEFVALWLLWHYS
jgi:hypothetical protein